MRLRSMPVPGRFPVQSNLRRAREGAHRPFDRSAGPGRARTGAGHDRGHRAEGGRSGILPCVEAGGRRRFGVDRDLCIGCRLCEERAPENFEVPSDVSWSRVFQQPRDEQEERACLEAQEYCPTACVYVEEEDAPDEA